VGTSLKHRTSPVLPNALAINGLDELSENLEKDYTIGTSLGNNLYKIRLAIESKNKGKSAGARVIYFFLNQDNEIYLIHIFDKSQFDNIPKHILSDLLKNAGLG
jgi:hypothetical protein